MRSHPTDEWPNLSALDDSRPRFANGEPVSPLSSTPQSSSTISVLVFALICLYLAGAFIKACTEIANQPDAAAESK